MSEHKPSRHLETPNQETRIQERRSTWQRKLLEVERITDGLGKRIDEGIKETVVGLILNGFPTTGSCEGHFDRAPAHPWVDIEAPRPEGWNEIEVEVRKLGASPHPSMLPEVIEDAYREKSREWREANRPSPAARDVTLERVLSRSFSAY
jgi:hypothetical protein